MLKILYDLDRRRSVKSQAIKANRAKKLIEYDYLNKRGHLEDEFFTWSSEEVDALVHRLQSTIGTFDGVDVLDPDIED
jgi:hypothetical protein